MGVKFQTCYHQNQTFFFNCGATFACCIFATSNIMISLEKKCSIFNLRDIHAQRGWTILESQLHNFVQME